MPAPLFVPEHCFHQDCSVRWVTKKHGELRHSLHPSHLFNVGEVDKGICFVGRAFGKLSKGVGPEDITKHTEDAEFPCRTFSTCVGNVPPSARIQAPPQVILFSQTGTSSMQHIPGESGVRHMYQCGVPQVTCNVKSACNQAGRKRFNFHNFRVPRNHEDSICASF